MSRNVLVAALILAGGVAGCTNTAVDEAATASSVRRISGSAVSSSSSPLPSSQPADGCSTQVQPPADVSGLEMRLLPGDLVGWALLFTGELPWPLGEEIKVAWRVDGAGELSAVSIGPSGEEVEPDHLIAHGGSNWERPGDEWGSSWTFPRAGCWELRVTRGNDSASIRVLVA